MSEAVIHILDHVNRSRDPDRRAEAVAFYGSFQECSGSGKHSMVHLASQANCQMCIRMKKSQERYFHEHGADC